MTKFQWEQQLSKYLSEIPTLERRRILEYYDELFQDKYENGESEEGIIASFGEPATIAIEILRSYDCGTLYAKGAAEAARAINQAQGPREKPEQIHTQGSSFEAKQCERASSGGINLGGDGSTNEGAAECDNQKSQKSSKSSFFGIRPSSPLMIVLYVFLFVTVGIPILTTAFGLAVGGLGIIIALASLSVGGIVSIILVLCMGMPLAQTLAVVGAGLFLSGIGFAVLPITIRVIKYIVRGSIAIVKRIHLYFTSNKKLA